MKRICALSLVFVMLFTLLIPASASLPTQDKSCTEGFTGGDTDGDGKVTSSDAAELIRYITGWQITGDASHADTLRDGVINAKDVSKLLKYLAGWNVGRLCHDDEYVVVKDSTVMEQGTARHVCRVCGDYAEETIPYKTYTVCGTDITEYRVIYGTNGMAVNDEETITGMMNATADLLTGGHYELEQLTAKNKTKKAFDHEILIGNVSVFTRDGLPEFEENVPCYGITEDGTVYFHVTNAALLGEMWLEMFRERFGVDFHIVNNYDPHLELVSYNENGADAQPFTKTFDTVDLDAEGYKLVYEENFDGDGLDMEKWRVRNPGKERSGFNAGSQVSLSDGELHLKAEYLENGDYGPGWYAPSVSLLKWYCRGYFEARIKCSDNDGGFWSAFWMQGKNPYVPAGSQGGIGYGGCEIDILELFGDTGVTYNLYAAGGKGSDKTDTFENYNSWNYCFGDLVGEYHTYALEWDEDYYTFYIDGILVGRTSFADGTSVSEEEVILSLCISETLTKNKDYTTEMVVDYLRIYQK